MNGDAADDAVGVLSCFCCRCLMHVQGNTLFLERPGGGPSVTYSNDPWKSPEPDVCVVVCICALIVYIQ
jgi:hypothetical protein